MNRLILETLRLLLVGQREEARGREPYFVSVEEQIARIDDALRAWPAGEEPIGEPLPEWDKAQPVRCRFGDCEAKPAVFISGVAYCAAHGYGMRR